MDWNKIEELKPIMYKKLSAVERVLFYQDFCTMEDLKDELQVGQRSVEGYIKSLRECYGSADFNDVIGEGRPPKYRLKNRDIASLVFPEMMLTKNERKLLHDILKLAAIFDGAIPLKEILEMSGCMDEDIKNILNGFSDKMEIQLEPKIARLIANIYTAITERQVISFHWPKLCENYVTNGDVLHVAPYYIKRYEGNWYLIGGIRNLPARNAGWVDFPWTVFPLQRILKANHTDNPIWRCENQTIRYKEIDVKRIENYYSHVIGFHVPTKYGEKFKEELDVRKIVLKVNPSNQTMRRLKEYPLHKSQKYNEEDGTVTINVIENNELYSRLLSYGGNIEVLEPKEVRERMKEKMAEALTVYNK